ncbi:MAG: transposase [Chloroflexi bacterium]|nr:transposase [Chloroflexota bacterium]
MRVGLRGTTRRVWGRRGVKVRQPLQLVYEWQYLPLVVDPLSGRLWWLWADTMRAPAARALVEATRAETDLAALVWDRAPGHRDETVRAAGLPLIEPPPSSPELNPAERVFEHLRARIEGEVYPSLGAKVAKVEAHLEELDADPERVKRLTGWHWIADNLRRLWRENVA